MNILNNSIILAYFGIWRIFFLFRISKFLTRKFEQYFFPFIFMDLYWNWTSANIITSKLYLKLSILKHIDWEINSRKLPLDKYNTSFVRVFTFKYHSFLKKYFLTYSIARFLYLIYQNIFCRISDIQKENTFTNSIIVSKIYMTFSVFIKWINLPV